MALVARQYRTRGAILYGSRARGDHGPASDADLLVLLEGEHQRFIPTKLALTDLAYDVLLDTGLYISALPVWTDAGMRRVARMLFTITPTDPLTRRARLQRTRC